VQPSTPLGPDQVNVLLLLLPTTISEQTVTVISLFADQKKMTGARTGASLTRAEPPSAVNQAISRAQEKRRNTYLLRGQLDRKGLTSIFACAARIQCRIRFCFTDALLIGEATDALASFFAENPDLDALIFANVTVQKSVSLFSSLRHCQSLATLSLSHCNLTDADLDALFASFQTLSNLRTLEISRDHLGPSVFGNVCRALPVLPALTTFVWTGNQLGDPVSFAEAVVATPSLRFIDFSLCALTNDWVQTLGAVLDRDWQIADLKIENPGPPLSQKIARNRERFQAEQTGPSCRMIRYARPVSDDLFEV
jgi:hypothetical protein